MLLHLGLPIEGAPAPLHVAGVGPDPVVPIHVVCVIACCSEGLGAHVAGEGLDVGVKALVDLKISLLCESFATL